MKIPLENKALILSEKPFRLYIVLRGTPKPTNKLLGKHFHITNANAKTWKSNIYNTVQNKRPIKPLEKFNLYLIRHNYRTLDFDGLTAGFKPVVDGLIHARVIKNDGWRNTDHWYCDQIYRKKEDGSLIEVFVEEKNE